MKITVNVDCTPDEARAFFGLPDVRPMQEALMRQLQERLAANIQAIDPETLLRTWLPGGLQGLDQFQKAFWAQMSAALRGGEPKDEP